MSGDGGGGGRRRTANQVLSSDGRPAQTSVTSNVWVSRPQVFSRPLFGNTIRPFVNGKDYFADLIAAVDAATDEVCMLGWQINWDALLAPGVRLYDVVARAAARGVKFFVMPWDDANPLQTYETQTQIVLESISDVVKVMVARSQSDRNIQYFSHHQKMVVVDKTIAFVGGIDIAYGRYDDGGFDLQSDGQGRAFLNSHNPGLPPMRDIREDEGVDPDLMVGAYDAIFNRWGQLRRIRSGGHQVPYEPNLPLSDDPHLERNKARLKLLGPEQPRQPWADAQARIEGPAATALLRNFVQRWNSLTTTNRLPLPAMPQPATPDETAGVQVLRSAPAALRRAEYEALESRTGVVAPSGVEDDIQTAYKNLIAKANHFIYIENQFFVSAFGVVGGHDAGLSPVARYIENVWGMASIKLHLLRSRDADANVQGGAALDRLPQNGICAALVERVTKAILDRARPNFHIYITLPVHSEGSLLDPTVAVQVYWTMQTISFGSMSLLNGIKRALKARELRDARDRRWQRALAAGSTLHADMPDDACAEYVTLLNLRSWKALPDETVVSEQVYIHTKAMIVDDLYAILGSANINDRSQLGSRDSELAILVVDGATGTADVNGPGSAQPVRTFAHELRKSMWKQMFGLASGVRPADELAAAVDAPGHPDSWAGIQRRAEENARLYEAAFPWVPRSEVVNAQGRRVPASLLPTWDRAANALASPLPYEERFWTDAANRRPADHQLDQVRGFITALPTRWTRGENIHIRFPTSLIVQNDPPGSAASTETAVATTIPSGDRRETAAS